MQQWRQGELQQEDDYEEGLEQDIANMESVNASSGPTQEQVEPQDDDAARGTQYDKDTK